MNLLATHKKHYSIRHTENSTIFHTTPVYFMAFIDKYRIFTTSFMFGKHYAHILVGDK